MRLAAGVAFFAGFFAATFFAGFLAGFFAAPAFLAVFFVAFFAALVRRARVEGSALRRSARSSQARSRLIVSITSPIRSVALVSPSLT